MDDDISDWDLRAIWQNYSILPFVIKLDQLKDWNEFLHFWNDWKGIKVCMVDSLSFSSSVMN